MSDTERLDLIEHYGWTIKFIDGGCHIVLHRAATYAFAKTIREAFDLAFAKQAKWAMS